MAILSVPEILSKKRSGEELLDGELEYFIDCVCKQEIDRSQVSDTYDLLLMTCCFNLIALLNLLLNFQ